MGFTPEKRQLQSPEPRAPVSRQGRPLFEASGPAGIWFVPARWLVIAFAITKLLLNGGTFAKVGAAGLVWSFVPWRLKIVTVGLAAAGMLVIAGSLAAIALLALQLT